MKKVGLIVRYLAGDTYAHGIGATGSYLELLPNLIDGAAKGSGGATTGLTLQGVNNVVLWVPTGKKIRFYDAGTVDFFEFYYGTPDCIVETPTDKNIFLNTLGTGKIKFGAYTVGAATASTGYITILDAAGNTRKLMVQA